MVSGQSCPGAHLCPPCRALSLQGLLVPISQKLRLRPRQLPPPNAHPSPLGPVLPPSGSRPLHPGHALLQRGGVPGGGPVLPQVPPRWVQPCRDPLWGMPGPGLWAGAEIKATSLGPSPSIPGTPIMGGLEPLGHRRAAPCSFHFPPETLSSLSRGGGWGVEAHYGQLLGLRTRPQCPRRPHILLESSPFPQRWLTVAQRRVSPCGGSHGCLGSRGVPRSECVHPLGCRLPGEGGLWGV